MGVEVGLQVIENNCLSKGTFWEEFGMVRGRMEVEEARLGRAALGIQTSHSG